MPTHITQIDDAEQARTILRVEGSLTLEDAALLAKICRDIQQQSTGSIAVDLADLSFLDSDSASALCQLKQQGVSLEGVHLFVQNAIELAEKSDATKMR